ncbi:MAG: DUF1499 domain-containing protein [Gemmatimonadetes bacterium]|nr:DUF1499 domain-containing protein [Gemmatimonadota bacterium]
MSFVKLLPRRLFRALTRNVAETHPGEPDPRLRGRTYAIPFDEIWNAALKLAGGALPRWRLVHTDDREGVIRAKARTRVFRFVDDVVIHIGLDLNGQTRLDLRSRSRRGWVDLGMNARRIGRFCRRLDAAVRATPAHILPAAPPARAASARTATEARK